MNYRTEHDTMGEILVPKDSYWGAQTQRSLENFPIGQEKMPCEIIRAFAVLKSAAAAANRQLRPDRMTEQKHALITRACNEILHGELDDHFPLVVWQTGSGTQSNMNVNEVIANRANALADKLSLHPNDDVNMSQSSNDTFPTAMHIAAVLAVEHIVLPPGESHPPVGTETDAVLRIEPLEGIVRIPRAAAVQRAEAGRAADAERPVSEFSLHGGEKVPDRAADPLRRLRGKVDGSDSDLRHAVTVSERVPDPVD